MANYTPQEDDRVQWKGHGSTRYEVLKVDASTKTADLQTIASGLGVVYYEGRVPWSELSP
jgi:hypothetical protein